MGVLTVKFELMATYLHNSWWMVDPLMASMKQRMPPGISVH